MLFLISQWPDIADSRRESKSKYQSDLLYRDRDEFMRVTSLISQVINMLVPIRASFPEIASVSLFGFLINHSRTHTVFLFVVIKYIMCSLLECGREEPELWKLGKLWSFDM